MGTLAVRSEDCALTRPFRLTVRTRPFHGCNTSSILVGVANKVRGVLCFLPARRLNAFSLVEPLLLKVRDRIEFARCQPGQPGEKGRNIKDSGGFLKVGPVVGFKEEIRSRSQGAVYALQIIRGDKAMKGVAFFRPRIREKQVDAVGAPSGQEP